MLAVDMENNVEVVPGLGASPDAFKPAVDVRTYFPETWLWSLNLVG